MNRKQVWIGTVAVLVAGAAVGFFVGQGAAHRSHRLSAAAWERVFDSPRALVRGVDAVVLATVVDVRPGRVAYSDNGEDALPFQVVEVEVQRAIKGAGAGDTLLIERAGGIDPEGHDVFLDADGGDFEVGREYVLFLSRQPEGDLFYQVNHQARYEVKAGRLAGVDPDDPVVTRFHGRTLEEGLAFAEAAARPRTPVVR